MQKPYSKLFRVFFIADFYNGISISILSARFREVAVFLERS